MLRGTDERIHAQRLDLLELLLAPLFSLGLADLLGLADALLTLCREIALAFLYAPTKEVLRQGLLVATDRACTSVHACKA